MTKTLKEEVAEYNGSDIETKIAAVLNADLQNVHTRILISQLLSTIKSHLLAELPKEREGCGNTACLCFRCIKSAEYNQALAEVRQKIEEVL